MSSRFLAFPRLNVAVQADPDVLENLELFYPHSLVDVPPPDLDHEYELKRDDSSWSLHRDGNHIHPFHSAHLALMGLEFDLEGILVSKADDLVALHAGAVVVDEEACLIAGNSEAGKTTTTFNLVELGHDFLCEEISLVEPTTWRVQPYPQTLSLGDEVIREAERYFPIKCGEVRPLACSTSRYRPHHFCDQPTSAGTILLPRYSPEASPGLTDLSPGETLTEMLGYCFEPSRDDEYLFDNVIALLGECRIVRLHYDSMASARRMLSELFPAT